jgi:PhnB protein
MAGVEDPFGFQWYIATHIKDVSPEEMNAAMAAQKP